MGAQASLAPIPLGASIPDVVQVLRAHCTPKEIDELVGVSIPSCTALMRRLTPTLHAETADSHALQVQQYGFLIMGLWSRIRACRLWSRVRACRSELRVLRHQRSLPWARRSTSDFLDLQQSIGAREAELADSVVELTATLASYRQLSKDYDTAFERVRGLLDSAKALRSEAEAHLRDIRAFVSSFFE